jgi:hypothetical protein
MLEAAKREVGSAQCSTVFWVDRIKTSEKMKLARLF